MKKSLYMTILYMPVMKKVILGRLWETDKPKG